MAKPLPLIVGGVGLTGAAVGGVYLAGRAEQASSTKATGKEASGGVASVPEAKSEKFFEDVDVFKGSAKESSCVKDLFGEGFTISTSGVEDVGANKPTTNTFFKTDDGDQSSCLVIQWKKKNGNNNKGNGKFTGLWAFTRGDEGFVTFNVAEPSSEDNKLKFTGVFYLVSKEASGGVVKYKKETTGEDKKAAKTEFDHHFPKAHTDVKGEKGDYWGFIQNKDEDVDKVCKVGSGGTCDGIALGDAQITRLKWTSNKTGDKTIWGGSASDEGWNKMYEANEGKLKDKLTEIKGTGTSVPNPT